MSDIQTRDAVHLHTLHSAIVTAYPPLYIKATNENYPAAFMGHPFSKGQAELLARTIAPSLFDTTRLEKIRDDLAETESSWTGELDASVNGDWTAEAVRSSLSGLLEAVRSTLNQLDGLLHGE